ncbi:pentapeptide repeat-containing protein [Shimia sp. R9_2]|uniref:pentapeptide repeat-containing protein n=1 Tax=Shimia sp. R9_2 TaxID=2821112 RepID=UPI001ADB2B6F|nr:pentapeptide repeat-containing protein [Shimia sp. R9_2]MBO9395996.1 pentapeptide repeat-containing protein [Shimia sp. R9_2]
MTTITLTTEDFQFLAAFVSSMIAAVVIFLALPRTDSGKETTFARLQEALGAKRWPAKWFLAVAVFWAVLALCLFGGLIATIGMIVHQLFFAEDFTANRFPLIQLAALTATLGAVVALPFTVLRLKLTQEQTETAKAALFNDKITEAAADLHAQRQVSKETDSGWETVWEDDVVRRNAAIDRLEGLVREEPEEAARVSRLLSVYVRELSKVYPAVPEPNTDNPKILVDWVRRLEVQRSDMQNAVQVLGRLTTIDGVSAEAVGIDLSGSNLQAMELTKLNFKNALLKNAALQGANLNSAQLQFTVLNDSSFVGANLTFANFEWSIIWLSDFRYVSGTMATFSAASLWGSKFHGATFPKANFKDCVLTDTDMEGTNLNSANLSGSDLDRSKFDSTTKLSEVDFTAASIRNVDFTSVSEIEGHLDKVFGDSSTKLPNSLALPSSWPSADSSYKNFRSAHCNWARSKGFSVPGPRAM